jgi:ribosome-associated translation inhibitor RaiA
MIPVTVTFHGMRQSDRMEADIVRRARRLDTCSDRITACHVVVTAPSRHHKSGSQLGWGIELHVPLGPVSVSRAKDVGDAFDLARRRLVERAARRRAGRRRAAG